MSRNILRRIRRDELAHDAEQRVIPRVLLPQGDRSVVARVPEALREFVRAALQELNRRLDVAVAVRAYDDAAALVLTKLAVKGKVDELA